MNTKIAQSPFSPDFLAQVKAVLEIERQKLQDELGQVATPNAKTPGYFETTFPEYGDDLEDNAQEVTDYLAAKPVEMTLEKSLRDIHTALKRLGEGTYGICKYCDKPIDEKRLIARPTSSSCVSCKKTLTDEA